MNQVKKCLFIFIYVAVSVRVNATYVWVSLEASWISELELQLRRKLPDLGVGKCTLVLSRAASILNHGAISPATYEVQL